MSAGVDVARHVHRLARSRPRGTAGRRPSSARGPARRCERMPLRGLNAQSNTARCSSASGRARLRSCRARRCRPGSTRSAARRSRASCRASGTVWLTILSMPPPASCLYFTRAMSGSMPVVSQSIMKLIVPVGASTVAWRCGSRARGRRRAPRPTAARAASCRYGRAGGVDLLDRVAMHLHHAEHRLAIHARSPRTGRRRRPARRWSGWPRRAGAP